MTRLLRRGGIALFGMVFLTGLAFLTLPLGHAVWTEVLGISGSIVTGAWEPPSQSGTSLEAEKSADGFREAADNGERTGVRGSVCVMNTGDIPTEDLAILDVVQIKIGPAKFADYMAVALDLSANPVLDPGEYHCYPYELEFLPVEKAKYRNVARVTIANHSGWLPGGPHCPGPDPCPFGPEPKTGFELPELPGTFGGNIRQQPPEPPVLIPSMTPTLKPFPTGTPLPPEDGSSPPELTLTPTPTATSIPNASPSPGESILPTPTLAPTSQPDPGCTHSTGYWQSHPKQWQLNKILLGDREFPKAEALEILDLNSTADASLILAQQAIGVRLNAASGADASGILALLSDTDDWLKKHPPGSDPAGGARSAGFQLAGGLEDFNLGLVGPDLCAVDFPTPAPTQVPSTGTPIPSPTVTDTAIPTETPLPTPTLAWTPTETPTSTPTILPPTETPEPTPTSGADVDPQPSPTDPPLPTPTLAPTSDPD